MSIIDYIFVEKTKNIDEFSDEIVEILLKHYLFHKELICAFVKSEINIAKQYIELDFDLELNCKINDNYIEFVQLEFKKLLTYLDKELQLKIALLILKKLILKIKN